jgi:hypothetical protein
VAIPAHQGTHPVTTSTKAKCQAVGDGQNQSIVGLGVFDLDQCANCDGVVGFMSRTSVTEDAVFSFSLTRPPAWWPFFFQAELSTVPSRERNHTHRVKVVPSPTKKLRMSSCGAFLFGPPLPAALVCPRQKLA